MLARAALAGLVCVSVALASTDRRRLPANLAASTGEKTVLLLPISWQFSDARVADASLTAVAVDVPRWFSRTSSGAYTLTSTTPGAGSCIYYVTVDVASASAASLTSVAAQAADYAVTGYQAGDACYAVASSFDHVALFMPQGEPTAFAFVATALQPGAQSWFVGEPAVDGIAYMVRSLLHNLVSKRAPSAERSSGRPRGAARAHAMRSAGAVAFLSR